MKFFLDNWWLIAIAFVSGGALIWPAFQRSMGGQGLTHFEATRLINDKNALLLDVRPADQFQRSHIVGAKNVPIDELAARANEIHKSKAHPIVVVCENGRRAVNAGAQLKTAGFTDVSTLEGGIAAWQAAGLPLKQKSS